MNVFRRLIIFACIISMLVIAFPSTAWARKLKELNIYVPPVGVGVVMVDVAYSGTLDAYVDKVNVVRWDSPDQLRAGILDGSIDITFVPSYTGANFYNKGIKFQLMNIITGGILYIISTDKTIKDIGDLKGKTVVVPFQNDMPDLVLQVLLKKQGLRIGKDVTIKYAATPTVAVKMALAGKADTLLLPEIAGTKVKIMAKKKQNINFHHVVDIQKEWGRLLKTSPYIPQAGIAVRESFAKAHPKLVKAIQAQIKVSAKKLLSDNKRVVAMTEKLWKGQGKIFVKSINLWNIDVKSSYDVKSALESFYSVLKDLNPKIIGGKLPDIGFYMKD